ncbi:MAG: polysaccharide deacetylase family protein [Candidatus Sumerlaeota bacterium]|nr:polysaccharide deacetylase family protein [Candidatus Sumerlaeota bacterium]
MSDIQTQPAFEWPGGQKGAVSLSFDDARLSQIDNALPLLDRYGVKATFYVSLPGVDKRLDRWRQAVANGHEIGNHSLTHPCSANLPFVNRPDHALENFTLERMEGELSGANEAIQARLGVTPETFAYPCSQTFVGRGEHLQSYVPLVARRFLAGRIAFNGHPNRPAFCDPAQVASFDLDRAPWDVVHEVVERTLAQNAWAVFMSHDVGDEDKRQVTKRDVLESLCRLLTERRGEIWCDTVSAVIRHIRSKRGLQ